MTQDESIRAALVEAIAWWRAGLPGGRELLAQTATDALAGTMDGFALVELACLRSSETAIAVDGVIERLVDEQYLRAKVDADLTPIAVRRVCRLVVSGRITERELVRWVHSAFGHTAADPELQRLALLDDHYDEDEAMGQDLTQVRHEIRAVAQRISTSPPEDLEARA